MNQWENGQQCIIINMVGKKQPWGNNGRGPFIWDTKVFLRPSLLKLILKMNGILPGGTPQAENSKFIRPGARKGLVCPRSGRKPVWQRA